MLFLFFDQIQIFLEKLMTKYEANTGVNICHVAIDLFHFLKFASKPCSNISGLANTDGFSII